MDLENLNLTELTVLENQEILGGSNLWEDVAYVIGVVARGLESFGNGGVSGSANRFA
ncbi:hypothetical protein IUY40_14385 [Flavobacterium sp. ALJ2]|uniref:hypothetical protein n=1 Tax=Flavobacterium sp. ALJ2 TaxID=2786960 RepID=UPI00189FBE24|nr:hypothetical protein [Flavobacterium sp. ALJ2]MBF7092721.1 hypothetical protein [Flavobacterium sp. ALJ2]